MSRDPRVAREMSPQREMEFKNNILVEVSGHKLEPYRSFCLVFYQHFSVLKMLFMNGLEFSCFADFFKGFLNPEKSMVFF